MGHLDGSISEASAFGSGHDPWVLESSPASGSLLSGEHGSSSPAPSSPAALPTCILSQMNKIKNQHEQAKINFRVQVYVYICLASLLQICRWGWAALSVTGMWRRLGPEAFEGSLAHAAAPGLDTAGAGTGAAAWHLSAGGCYSSGSRAAEDTTGSASITLASAMPSTGKDLRSTAGQGTS